VKRRFDQACLFRRLILIRAARPTSRRTLETLYRVWQAKKFAADAALKKGNFVLSFILITPNIHCRLLAKDWTINQSNYLFRLKFQSVYQPNFSFVICLS